MPPTHGALRNRCAGGTLPDFSLTVAQPLTVFLES